MPDCTETTAKGKPCKGKAVAGSDPPRCASHLGLVGRESKLDEQTTELIVTMLRAGNYVDTAVSAAGVARSTYYDWLRRGDPAGTDPADEVYRVFRDRIEKAQAEGEARNVALISKQAPSDWKAAAWILERLYPERWARASQRSEGDKGSGDDGTSDDPWAALDRETADVIPIRR